MLRASASRRRGALRGDPGAAAPRSAARPAPGAALGGGAAPGVQSACSGGTTSCAEALSFLGGGLLAARRAGRLRRDRQPRGVRDRLLRRDVHATTASSRRCSSSRACSASSSSSTPWASRRIDWAAAAATAISHGRPASPAGPRALVPASMRPSGSRSSRGYCERAWVSIETHAVRPGERARRRRRAPQALLGDDVACVYLENPGYPRHDRDRGARDRRRRARGGRARGRRRRPDLARRARARRRATAPTSSAASCSRSGIHHALRRRAGRLHRLRRTRRLVAEYPTFLLGLAQHGGGRVRVRRGRLGAHLLRPARRAARVHRARRRTCGRSRRRSTSRCSGRTGMAELGEGDHAARAVRRAAPRRGRRRAVPARSRRRLQGVRRRSRRARGKTVADGQRGAAGARHLRRTRLSARDRRGSAQSAARSA